MRTIIVTTAVCLVALVAAGCGGDSTATKAKSQACDARSDIQKQIDTLKGLPLTAASIDPAKAAVSAISADLTEIQEATPDVTGDLKSQLEQANASFKSAVESIAATISTSSDLATITAALTSAGTSLQSAYQSAFADVKC